MKRTNVVPQRTIAKINKLLDTYEYTYAAFFFHDDVQPVIDILKNDPGVDPWLKRKLRKDTYCVIRAVRVARRARTSFISTRTRRRCSCP